MILGGGDGARRWRRSGSGHRCGHLSSRLRSRRQCKRYMCDVGYAVFCRVLCGAATVERGEAGGAPDGEHPRRTRSLLKHGIERGYPRISRGQICTPPCYRRHLEGKGESRIVSGWDFGSGVGHGLLRVGRGGAEARGKTKHRHNLYVPRIPVPLAG